MACGKNCAECDEATGQCFSCFGNILPIQGDCTGVNQGRVQNCEITNAFGDCFRCNEKFALTSTNDCKSVEDLCERLLYWGPQCQICRDGAYVTATGRCLLREKRSGWFNSYVVGFLLGVAIGVGLFLCTNTKLKKKQKEGEKEDLIAAE